MTTSLFYGILSLSFDTDLVFRSNSIYFIFIPLWKLI